MNLTVDVINILKKIEENGYESFIVGGAVRDFVLEREINDFDIASSASVEELFEIFCDERIVQTGLKHGTLTLVKNWVNYEITSFREDAKSIEDDLGLRDFTINAMAYENSKGIIDPFFGAEDIKKGIVKIVGNKDEIIKSDPLRILRGVRFATVLDYSIDKKSFEIMKNYADMLDKVSAERIQIELNKILLAEKPSKAFQLMIELDILKTVLPELEICVGFEQNNPHHRYDVYYHIMEVLDSSDPDLITRLAALFHDIGKPQTYSEDERGIGHFYRHEKISCEMSSKIMKRLKYDNKSIKIVCNLVESHMLRGIHYKDKTIKKLINRVGKENIDRLKSILRADSSGGKNLNSDNDLGILFDQIDRILEENEVFKRSDLKINGKDLIALGISDGREIGEILDILLDKTLEDPKLNKKEKLIKLVKKIEINEHLL